MIDSSDRSRIITAVLYFTLSTAITWWFIDAAPVYSSIEQKLLSCSIAGAKWTIQIVFALFFLQGRTWIFLRNIGQTCLIGSLILLPFSVSSTWGLGNNSQFFLSSLIASIAVMVVSYYWSVKKSQVPTLWWGGWMLCLVVAITLQLKVVFNLWIF